MSTNRTEADRLDLESEDMWPFPAARRSEPLAASCQGLFEETSTEHLGDLDARDRRSVSIALAGLLNRLDRRLDGIDAEIVRGRAEMRAEYAAVKEECRLLRAAYTQQSASMGLLAKAIEDLRRPLPESDA